MSLLPATPPVDDQVAPPYLERYVEQGGPSERVPLVKLPFTLGRSTAVDHVVYSNRVSKEHAAIVLLHNRYLVRDLNSTNGTFVNGRRTFEQTLVDSDIIHLAHVEFCFRQPESRRRIGLPPRESEQTHAVLAIPPDSLIRGSRLLRELIAREAVHVAYQPIVDLRTRQVMAYEALGRGLHPDLSKSPEELLRLADGCGMGVELSRLFARQAVICSRKLSVGAKVFINMHAREIERTDIADALGALRGLASELHPLVIEVNESTVTTAGAMARTKSLFASFGMEFAYDDFGTGQNRLLELAEAPPQFLKLDRAVVKDLDLAPVRQEMVQALVGFASSLGVRTVAEGIETERVAAICQALGCTLGQGYLFGRPE